MNVSKRVTVTAAIEVPCAPERALPAVWDIASIERFEVKADKVVVHPLDTRTGAYDVRGHFAGVPWHGRFEYELTDHGFHSRTADVPRAEATVEGGFLVTPLSEAECTVIHYEQYVLPGWLILLAPPIRAYLRWSMRRELRDLRAAILADYAAPTTSNSPRMPLVQWGFAAPPCSSPPPCSELDVVPTSTKQETT